jgi:hypothetical protein
MGLLKFEIHIWLAIQGRMWAAEETRMGPGMVDSLPAMQSSSRDGRSYRCQLRAGQPRHAILSHRGLKA